MEEGPREGTRTQKRQLLFFILSSLTILDASRAEVAFAIFFAFHNATEAPQ